MPGSVWRDLFEYQRTGLKWLWELRCQEVGGLIGDDMGLGKTVQVRRCWRGCLLCPSLLLSIAGGLSLADR